MRKICFVIVLLTLLLLSACQAVRNPEIDQLVDIDTDRLHLLCIGQGSPTVVIDAGVGDTAELWPTSIGFDASYCRNFGTRRF